MTNPLDVMLQGPGGAAWQRLARQLGLLPEQQAEALRALAPAFQLALARCMAQPQAIRELAELLTRDPKAFLEPAPRQPEGIGHDVLVKLFGSDEVARAVAAHAATASGLSEAVMRQMLPQTANMMMAGLARQAAPPAPAAPTLNHAAMLETLLAPWMAAWKGTAQADPPSPPAPPPTDARTPSVGEASDVIDAGLAAWRDAVKAGFETQQSYLEGLRHILGEGPKG